MANGIDLSTKWLTENFGESYNNLIQENEDESEKIEKEAEKKR